MKKTLFVLFICILLTIGAICSASAQTETEVSFFSPQKSEYLSLSSPYLTATTDNVTVIFDNDGFKILSDTTESIQSSYHYTCASIYENYLFAVTGENENTSDNYLVFVYNLQNGEKIQGTVFDTVSARFITIKDSLLYLNTGSSINVYDLSNQEITLTSTKPYASELFAINDSNQTIFNSTIAGSKYIAIQENNVRTQIDYEFSDISSFDGEVYTLFSYPTYNAIHVYDSTTLEYKRNFYLPYASSNVETNNGKLLVTYPDINSVDVYSIDSFEYLYSICSNGNQAARFDSPSRVYAHGDYVTVADQNNNRLIRFDSNGQKVQTLTLDSKVSDAIDYGTKAYVIAGNTIRMTTGGANTVYDKADGVLFTSLKSLAVDCFGTVYAIDGERVISKSDSDSTFKVFAKVSPLCLTVSPKGSVLYMTYSDKISAYDSLGKVIFTSSISSNLSQNAVCDCDVGGNMFVLDGDKLIRFARSLSGYTYDKTLNLTLSGQSFAGSSISISTNGSLYLTQKDTHAIFTLDKSITGASVYNSSEFTPPVDVYEKTPLSLPLTFVKVNAGGGFVYDFSQSYENTRVINENTILYLLDNESVNGFYYVYYSGKVGYIPTTSVTVLDTTTFASYDAFALVTTEIYKYPNKNTEFNMDELLKGTSFKVVGNSCNFTSIENGKTVYWNEILYQDKIYYIERTHIAPANPTRAVDYGYAKLRAPSVGTKICVYALPDENSALLGEFADGTEVKLLGEIDEGSTFTEVKIGDLIGYVKTTELTTNGLTTAQTVILILVLIGGLASVTILVISRKMHRKN